MLDSLVRVEMKKDLLVSVVIPTYNRQDSLRRTLESLVGQTMAADSFEVTVVDDGSEDRTAAVAADSWPFAVRYLKQQNCGATAARNHGAQYSQGEVLVFVDDDITVAPAALQSLYQTCLAEAQVVVLGVLSAPEQGNPLVEYLAIRPGSSDCVHFSKCTTGLLAAKWSDFMGLGMFQDPTGGWPNWDDVDFGYRADRAGYRLWRCPEAQAIHYDEAATNLNSASRRWFQASKSAVRLFQTYPDILPYFPMFRDMIPVAWGQDSPGLLARKLLRRLASAGPTIWLLERAAGVVRRLAPSTVVLRTLYRWIIGGYIFQGYHAGLRELRPATPPELSSFGGTSA